MKNKINNEIGEEQFGFKPNNGTREAIFCLNIISQKFIAVQKEIYAGFIDYLIESITYNLLNVWKRSESM
jgi:hypothetical protein